MGLIDFVKDAGESLLERAGVEPTKGAEAAPAAKTQPAAPKPAPADLPKILARTVSLLEIPVEDLEISIEGDVAIVSGTTPTQADRERLVLVIGNTRSIAKVDDRVTVKKPEPESVFHTVAKGDTLSGIAKAHYGDPKKYPAIFEANRPMLKDPDKIYPGQVLRIPRL